MLGTERNTSRGKLGGWAQDPQEKAPAGRQCQPKGMQLIQQDWTLGALSVILAKDAMSGGDAGSRAQFKFKPLLAP